MIKAVLIDIDNTVLDFNESAKQSVKQAFFITIWSSTRKPFQFLSRLTTSSGK